MSIVIKGMQMPETCEECMFAGWSNLHQTAVCNLLGWKIVFDDFSKEYKSKRADDCPLIALPEKHGRLGDLDALRRELIAGHDLVGAKYAELADAVFEAEGE